MYEYQIESEMYTKILAIDSETDKFVKTQLTRQNSSSPTIRNV